MHRRDILAWSVGTLGAGVLGTLTPRAARAGACAEPGFVPVYATPAGAQLGRGGAVLVTANMTFGGGPPDPFDGRYTMTVGGERVWLHATRVAPGLLRLAPVPFVAGAGVVSGPAGDLNVTWDTAAATPPAPCHVQAVDLYRHAGSQEPYSPSTWGLRARLRSPLPDSVLGVVVAQAAAGSRYGLYAPRSGDRMQGLYSSPGRCSADTPGAHPPAAGQRVRLACVGLNGVLSVRSNDVEIDD
jgi:hypothetical protein